MSKTSKVMGSGSKKSKPTKKISNKIENLEVENVVWKPVPFEYYKKKYRVSNDGRVKNILTEKMLSTQSLRSGYKSVHFILHGERAVYKLHRLVALVFVKNDDPENKKVVNHKDGNKMNNHYHNLEWMTIQENNQHSQDNGLTPKTCRAVYQCDLDGNIIKEHETIRGAGKDTGVDSGGIARACKGIRNSAGGFIWKFVNVNENEREIDTSKFIKIKDFPKYLINKDGDIYSIAYMKLMKKQTNAEGNKVISLCNGQRKSSSFLLHRLIAIHFVENDDPENKKRVIRINKDITDNRVENLRWVK